MTGWRADTLRWGAVGGVVLAAHVAGGVWAMTSLQRTTTLHLPEPVFADLMPEPAPPAPAPAAPSAPAEAAPEPEAEDTPELADFTPPPLPELPPVEDFSELLPETAPVADFEVPPLTPLPPITDFAELLPDSALLLTSSDRPRSRPVRREPEPEPQVTRREERRAPPQEQARQEPRRERAQPSPQTQRSAPAEGTARKGGGAQGTPQANTGVSKQQMNNWTSRVGGRVASHMKRTRVPGGGRGTVTIQLSVSISANGAASARLTSSTGNAQVDAALARQAGRMPRMPAPPNGQGASFTLPIQIKL